MNQRLPHDTPPPEPPEVSPEEMPETSQAVEASAETPEAPPAMDSSSTSVASPVDKPDADEDDPEDTPAGLLADIESDSQADEAPPLTPADLALHVEVALMTTDRAIPVAKLAEVLGKVGSKAIQEAVKRLNETYEDTGRSFRIEQVANGLQILTLPAFADVMERLHKTRSAGKLSPAAMETLAIIAYKQPILRAQIEAIRGVASGEVVRSLMERRLVKIVGRSDDIGRPMLYGTTKAFLETFGLSNLKDLPKAEELAAGKHL